MKRNYLKKLKLIFAFVFLINILVKPTVNVRAELSISMVKQKELEQSYEDELNSYKKRNTKIMLNAEEYDALLKYRDQTIPVRFYVNSTEEVKQYNDYHALNLVLDILEKQLDLELNLEIIYTKSGTVYEEQLKSINTDELGLDIVLTNNVTLFDNQENDVRLSKTILTEKVYVVSDFENINKLISSESTVGHDSAIYSLRTNALEEIQNIEKLSAEEANVQLMKQNIDYYLCVAHDLPRVVESSNLIYRHSISSEVLPSNIVGNYAFATQNENSELISIINQVITPDFADKINRHKDVYDSYVKEMAFYNSLTYDEKKYLLDNTVLNVYYSESPNLMFKSHGEIMGFIPEVMEEVSRLTHLTPVYIEPQDISVKSDSIITIDLLQVYSLYTDEVIKNIKGAFEDSQNTNQLYASSANQLKHSMEIIKHYTTPSIRNMNVLDFYTIGTTSAFQLNAKVFMDKNNLDPTQIKIYENQSDIIKALQNSTLDYAIVPPGSVNYYTENAEYKISSAYTLQTTNSQNTDSWSVLLHDEENVETLSRIFSKAVATVDYKEISSKWLPSKTEFIVYDKVSKNNNTRITFSIILAVATITTLWQLSKRKRKNFERVKLATTIDSITGLKNLTSFESDKFKMDSGYLIVAHLRNIKRSNQMYGMSKTDEFIKGYAELLKLHLGNSIYRIDTSKFYIYIEDESVDFESYIQKIEKVLNENDKIYKHNTSLNWVLAGAEINTDVYDFSTLLNLTVELARENNSTKYSILDENEIYNILERHKIKKSLKKITDKNILPYYQPFIDAKTYKVKGCEVLARLSIENEIIPAYKFISVAEDIGTLGEIDKALLENTIALREELLTNGIIDSDFYFSINLSAQFLKKVTTDDMYTLSKRFNIRSFDFLQIEILEEELTEEEVLKIKRIINEFSLKIAVDDFSTGHSTIERLYNFDFNVVKIDRSLLPIKFTELDRKIYNSLLSMIVSLIPNIVVEGVETEEHVEFLKRTPVSTLQGFYFAKPMPKEEFFNYIIERNDV